MSVVAGLYEGRPSRRFLPARVLRLASDERLVEMLRGGSEAAFEALFDRHHGGVLGFCRHMLGSVEEAEDAVQHTFLAAYRELADSDRPIQLRPWLYTIARNRCLTMLRTRGRLAHGELVEPPTEHLAAEVERRQDLRSLLGDVARLPEDQRAALVLSELGDMPHEEIAEVLGCRREKVKALVFQARSSLIASRSAREASCADVRELVANLKGGSLRRNEVRRHLSECAGCSEFREQVRRQRRELAVVLPVAPTIGLKAAVVGGAATSTAIATKVLVVVAIVGTGTAAVEVENTHKRAVAAAPPPHRSVVTQIIAPVKAHTPPAVLTPARHVHPVAAPATPKPVALTAKPKSKPQRKAAPHHASKPAKADAVVAPPAPATAPAAVSPPGHAKKEPKAKPVPPVKAEKAPKAKPAPPVKAEKAPKAKPAPPGQAKKQAAPKPPPPGQAKKQTPPAPAPKPVPPGHAKPQAQPAPPAPPGQTKKKDKP